MSLERDPEVQQIISALKQIASEPHRFSDNFKRQALETAVDMLQVAYRPKVTKPSTVLIPGQADIYGSVS